ncbi:hypothetical protein [Teredinibacter purpureus]|uniref:hypothetical protein n=1 Tax=Teredinibacter purpureus TaxID=2731756 RepID=UPI0005F85694|nr:hypothetical protein [Teredinibacter purpureus]
MKNIVIFIVVFIAAFLSGVFSSLLVTKNQQEAILLKTLSLGEVYISPQTEQSDYEFRASTANSIVEYAEKSDYDSLLSFACMHLNFSAEDLKPMVWEGASKFDYAVELKGKSMENLNELRKRGFCE